MRFAIPTCEVIFQTRACEIRGALRYSSNIFEDMLKCSTTRYVMHHSKLDEEVTTQLNDSTNTPCTLVSTLAFSMGFSIKWNYKT